MSHEEAALHWEAVSRGSLAALVKIRTMLIAKRPPLEITTALSTEIREIENLSKFGQRRPGNGMAVVK
jgi:hypothetical protein